jgi:hypothetical protein
MKVFTRRYLIVLFGFLILSSVVGRPGRALSGGVQDLRAGMKELKVEAKNPWAWLVSLFRDHLSAVDGDRCPSAPSCSSYSVQAFNKHGFVMGWLMTVDRLIHEGKEETTVSPLVYIDGRLKIYDPVQNNDFWWEKSYENNRD